MQIVFRKLVPRTNLRLQASTQVINRYELGADRKLTEAEIASIAAQLYKDDYKHPFTEDDGVYWVLE